eukprot:TRINITY_DN11982_c0_g1_i1.p1 TRINITY_DN11982_c0_g1~~TRINITY_DN11982_c0_g1_i1.p1  ORF type:complete len:268 (-),score=31.31 TRINITY_DN11982_c0_g1_i1:53-856(-)
MDGHNHSPPIYTPPARTTCLFCDTISPNYPQLHTHMKSIHQFDCPSLEDYDMYFDLWKMNCQEVPVQYLRRLLEVQQRERDDGGFKRKCLYCEIKVKTSREMYLVHLEEVHGLFIAQYNDLVHVDFLLDVLQSKIERFECLYCSLTFKNKLVYKTHVRKKKHYKIHAEDPFYQKFFINNYLNTEGEDLKFNEFPEFQEIDEDWEDWVGSVHIECRCLFCEHVSDSTTSCVTHMNDEHHFDLIQISKKLSDVHQYIKLINYIRSSVLF